MAEFVDREIGGRRRASRMYVGGSTGVRLHGEEDARERREAEAARQAEVEARILIYREQLERTGRIDYAAVAGIRAEQARAEAAAEARAAAARVAGF